MRYCSHQVQFEIVFSSTSNRSSKDAIAMTTLSYELKDFFFHFAFGSRNDRTLYKLNETNTTVPMTFIGTLTRIYGIQLYARKSH